jgi:hypothetical protein
VIVFTPIQRNFHVGGTAAPVRSVSFCFDLEMTGMQVRKLFVAGILAAASLAGACSSAGDNSTRPTAVAPPPAGGSEAPGGVNRGTPPVSPGLPPATGTCDASKAAFAIGQRGDDALLERARLAAGAGSARYLHPNQPITLEYLGSRLNLQLNEKDVVRAVTCG